MFIRNFFSEITSTCVTTHFNFFVTLNLVCLVHCGGMLHASELLSYPWELFSLASSEVFDMGTSAKPSSYREFVWLNCGATGSHRE